MKQQRSADKESSPDNKSKSREFIEKREKRAIEDAKIRKMNFDKLKIKPSAAKKPLLQELEEINEIKSLNRVQSDYTALKRAHFN